MLAAVARPRGDGSFQAVVLLHGNHEFAKEYVHLAEALSRAGVIAIAACWFSGGGGSGSRFITPLACPGAPAMPEAGSAVARRTVDALVQAARTLPGVGSNRVALFGHSRGGGAALNYILTNGTVQAAVLDSAGCPTEVRARAQQIDGKEVEAKYYEGGGHSEIFTNATQRDDEVQRMAAFLRRHVRN